MTPKSTRLLRPSSLGLCFVGEFFCARLCTKKNRHRLAQSHQIPLSGVSSRLEDTLRSWLTLVPDTYSDPAKETFAREHLDPAVIRAELDWLLTVCLLAK